MHQSEALIQISILLCSRYIFGFNPSCDYPSFNAFYFLQSKMLEILCNSIVDYQFYDKLIHVLA